MTTPIVRDETDRPMTRFQVANLVDLRTMIRSRGARSTHAVQATIYAMAAGAIELGLQEHAGITLTDSPGGTTWAESAEKA